MDLWTKVFQLSLLAGYGTTANPHAKLLFMFCAIEISKTVSRHQF